METNLTKAVCGECGNNKYEIYKDPGKEHLICECTKCKSTSEIVIAPPRIQIKWHGESKGCMHFPRK